MIRERIAFAAANQVPQVIVFSGPRGTIGEDEGMASCIAGLKQVAGEAEKAGVTLTLEVLNKFDHPGYQADYSAYAFAVAPGWGRRT